MFYQTDHTYWRYGHRVRCVHVSYLTEPGQWVTDVYLSYMS